MPVRAISLRANQDEYNPWVQAMKFEDADKRVVGDYNPYKRNGELRKVELEENEALIGVYGTYRSDRNNWFSRFGLIVKVKEVI